MELEWTCRKVTVNVLFKMHFWNEMRNLKLIFWLKDLRTWSWAFLIFHVFYSYHFIQIVNRLHCSNTKTFSKLTCWISNVFSKIHHHEPSLRSFAVQLQIFSSDSRHLFQIINVLIVSFELFHSEKFTALLSCMFARKGTPYSSSSWYLARVLENEIISRTNAIIIVWKFIPKIFHFM